MSLAEGTLVGCSKEMTLPLKNLIFNALSFQIAAGTVVSCLMNAENRQLLVRLQQHIKVYHRWVVL